MRMIKYLRKYNGSVPRQPTAPCVTKSVKVKVEHERADTCLSNSPGSDNCDMLLTSPFL